ncbi:MAG: PAS domain-containing sensor histidine kinase [Bacteroidota bacterium]
MREEKGRPFISNKSNSRNKINRITDSALAFEKLWESEESLRVLMNSNPEAVFILDREGNFVAANEKCAQRFGKPVEELIGTNVFSYLTPEIAEKRKAKVDEVIRTGKPLRFDDMRNNRYYDNYLHPIFDSQGSLIRIAVWVIDFTERKQALDALKASEEKFREIAENIQDIFWVRKGDELFYVSPAYEIICGKTCQSLYDNPNSFIEAVHPDDFERVIKSLSSDQYQREGKFDEEFRIIRPDGEIKWIWSRTFPVKRDNEVIRTVGIAEDITLLKKAEEDIQNAYKKEKELNELKSQFISMVSHEFRTPLGLILSSAELLQKYGAKWDEEKRNEQFGRIKKAIANLTGLMEDIIIIGGEETGKIKITPTETGLVLLIKEIIEEVKVSQNEQAAINFEYPNSNIKIFADEKLLRQIFLNLILNAVKYSKPEKKISIKLQPDADKIYFAIEDEGIGISYEDLKNIFEPFARGSNTGKTKGSGLGLAIVKQAVELLRGEIKVESKLNEGTKFSVTLPREIL